MKVSVHLLTAGQPKEYTNAVGTYTKEGCFGVILETLDGKRYVHKYPLTNIFRIVEDY